MSWMCTVGLCDELEFQLSDRIELSCDDPSIPNDERNLVVKAAQRLRPNPSAGASINLKKRIPAGGGLGGGSSDAVAALVALNKLWDLNWPLEKLAPIAATLGSDVSFFLYPPSAICSGVGEIVTPIAPPAVRWAVLILPAFGMETVKVYQQFDRMKLGRGEAIALAPDWTNWARLTAAELLPHLINDLEKPAFDLSTELARLRDDCQAQLSRPVCLSGSGSTLFTLFDRELDAHAAAQSLHGLSAKIQALRLAPDVRLSFES